MTRIISFSTYKNQALAALFSLIIFLGILIVPVQIGANYSQDDLVVNDQDLIFDYDKNNNKIEDFLDNRLIEIYPADLSGSTASERVIILLDERPTAQNVDYFNEMGAEVLDVFQYVDAVGVRMPVRLLASAAQYPPVKMIYGDEPAQPQLIDAVPVINADASSLSGAGYGNINGKGSTIAVIDSGIDSDHVTFSHNNIIAFRDYVFGNSDLDPTDGMTSYDYDNENGHGTMCGGTAAGNGGTTGYKGSAPGADLVAIATETSYDVALGIEWSINNQNKDFDKDGEPDGPDIITLSMGFGGAVMNNYADAAVDNGIVFITSAGNNGPGASTILSPATSSKVIAVGAIDDSKNIASFSSRGPGPGGSIKPEVCAPGVNVVIPTGGYWYYASGTSVSSPMVAGVAALILQYDPTLTPYEVREIFKDSAEDKGAPGPDNTYGWGVVDAVAALDSVLKVRDITVSKVVAYEDEELTFGISTSGDPSMIAKYEWDFDGDGKYDTESSEPDSIKHKYTKSSDYTIEVKITNTHGKFATGTKDIMITNRAPDARLEVEDENLYYNEDDVVTFNASKSWDTQSDINQLKYYWDFGDGNVTEWRNSPVISHGFADKGIFTVNLIVKDDDDATDSEDTEVEILNQEPFANAGKDKVVYEDEKVVFNGNLSIDSDSDIPTLDYIWNFGDGIISYGIVVNHTFKTTISNTTYTVTLTAIDDDGAKNEDSMLVKVMNLPPIVDAGKSKAVSEDEEVEFDGFGNDTFSDRDDLEYQWDFGDDKKSRWQDTPSTKHKYTEENVYIAMLSVKDPKGAINSSSIVVTVTNVVPEAAISADKKYADEEEIITFSAADSWDTSSDIKKLKYMWNFGDNTQGEGKTVAHAYLRSGKYIVNLTVIDDDNAKAKTQMDIQVVNVPPQAKIFIDKAEAGVGEIIRFEASKSWDTPSDRANLTFVWDFNPKDNVKEDTVGITATHKYTKPGEYTVKLKVIDDNGETDQVTKTITITGSSDEDDEGDMFSSPTIENQGVILYSAIGIIFLIFLMLILMLVLKRRIYKPLRPKPEPEPQRVTLDEMGSAQPPQQQPPPSMQGLQQYFDSQGSAQPEGQPYPLQTIMPPTHYQQPVYGTGIAIPPGGYPPEHPPEMQPAAPMFQQPPQELPSPQAPGMQYLPPVESQAEVQPQPKIKSQNDKPEPPTEEEQEE